MEENLPQQRHDTNAPCLFCRSFCIAIGTDWPSIHCSLGRWEVTRFSMTCEEHELRHQIRTHADCPDFMPVNRPTTAG